MKYETKPSRSMVEVLRIIITSLEAGNPLYADITAMLESLDSMPTEDIMSEIMSTLSVFGIDAPAPSVSDVSKMTAASLMCMSRLIGSLRETDERLADRMASDRAEMLSAIKVLTEQNAKLRKVITDMDEAAVNAHDSIVARLSAVECAAGLLK